MPRRTGDFTPSVLHRQLEDDEIAGHAKPRPNRLGSVKRPRDAASEFVDDQGFRDLLYTA